MICIFTGSRSWRNPGVYDVTRHALRYSTSVRLVFASASAARLLSRNDGAPGCLSTQHLRGCLKRKLYWLVYNNNTSIWKPWHHRHSCLTAIKAHKIIRRLNNANRNNKKTTVNRHLRYGLVTHQLIYNDVNIGFSLVPWRSSQIVGQHKDLNREMKCSAVQRSMSNRLIGIAHASHGTSSSIEAPTPQIAR